MGHICTLLPPEKTRSTVVLESPAAVGEVLEGAGLKGLYAGIIVDGLRRNENFILDKDCEVILISPASGG